MWLLDKMLKPLVREGRLHVIDHDGKTYDYGDPSADPITVRFTDKGAALHVAKDPRMGAGEAYMDGRMVVEPPHDIRDMILFLMGQANRKGGLQPPSKVKRLFDPAGEDPQPVERPAVVQGALEGSNVRPIREMTRLTAELREFQFAAQFAEKEGERLSTAVERILRRRT